MPRVTNVCLLRDRDRVLLVHVTCKETGAVWLVPPGGGLEPRETLEDGVRREIDEEVGVAIRDLRRLGVYEAIFRFAGRDQHEIVFVWEGTPDPHPGEEPAIEDNGHPYPAGWYRLADLDDATLHPRELRDLI